MEYLIFHGLVDIDIMSKKDSSLVVLEVNPRPSGSSIAIDNKWHPTL